MQRSLKDFALIAEICSAIAVIGTLIRMSRGEEYRDYEEEYIYITFLFSLFRKGSIAYSSYEDGLLDEDELTSLLQLPRLHTITKTGNPIWELYRPNVNPDYVAFVNAMPAGTLPSQS